MSFAKPLSQSGVGTFRCISVDAQGDDAIRLKRLGICEQRDLEVVISGDPMVVQVSGTRIGVSRILASMVQVCPAAVQKTSLAENRSPGTSHSPPELAQAK